MLKEIYEKAISNSVTEKDAVYILSLNSERLLELFFYSDSLRRHFKGNKVEICSIINAKSGNCPEDCAFCAQSAYSKLEINEYPLLGVKEMIKAACLSKGFHSKKFSIVISGRKLSNRKEVERTKKAVRKIREMGLMPCASLGFMDDEILKELKNVGLHTYHCNLETSRNFFRNICTTHSYEDKIETIKAAKRLGFYVCSGGIFGMGEKRKERVKFAFELKNLNVDGIPVNFLIPIKGTRMENMPFMESREALKTISMLRFVLPEKDIRICAGKEEVLRDLQFLMFFAGANGIMMGNYLTRKGRSPEGNLRMIEDLGLEIDKI